MKHVINVRKTALEIVQVLHQNEVPIASMQFVFQKAERLASIKTVPYSPSSDEIQEAVTCDTTDNGTLYPMVEDFSSFSPKPYRFERGQGNHGRVG